MRALITLCFLSLAITILAQEKTFERECTYKASELDSKVSCRAIAINQLRSMLLNEIGVYVESEQILKTSEVSGKFSQDFVENIATISAGITKLEVLDEKWNGETFYMKASITVDKKNLEEALKQLVADRQKLKELEEVKQKLNDATKEISRLKEAINKNRTNDQSGQLEKYKKEINTLTSTDYFFSGRLKVGIKDYTGAIADFTKAVEIDPNYKEGYYERAFSKEMLNNYQGAIDDFSRVVEIDPKFEWGYYMRGVVKLEMKNFQGAIVDITRALEINPKLALAYLNRGDAKVDLEDYKGAIIDYNKAIEIEPNNEMAYYTRGYVKDNMLKDYLSAIEDYTKTISLNPKNADAYYSRGYARMLSGQKNNACSDLRRAAELGREDAYDAIKEFCQ